MEIGKYFYSLLFSGFILLFLGIVLKTSENFLLISNANLFIVSGIVLIFITSSIPLILLTRNYMDNVKDIEKSLNPIDVLFLGVSMLVYVIYKDILLSISTFLILFSIFRILQGKK